MNKKTKFVILTATVLWFASNLVQAGVIVPPHINNLAVWLDGNDIDGDGIPEGLNESGVIDGKVSVWVDKTGNGYDAVQNNAANMPAIAVGALNGNTVLAFDGGVDGGHDYFDISWMPDMVNHSIYIVFNLSSPQVNAWSALVSLNTGGVSANYRSPHIFVRSTGQLGVSYTSNTGVHETFNLPSWVSGWHTMSTRHQNGQKAYGSQDGRSAWQSGGVFTQDAVIKSFDLIGADNAYRGMTGSIAEIIVYARALTDQEHNLVGYYLASKYGIDTQYVESIIPVAYVSQTDGKTSVYEYQTTSDTFDLALLYEPQNDVTFNLSVSYDDPNMTPQFTVEPQTLIFTTNNWQQPQTVTVTAIDNTDMEGTIYGQIDFAIDSADPLFTSANGLVWPLSVEVIDDETPNISVELVGKTLSVSEQESKPDTNKFSVRLFGRPQSDVIVSFSEQDVFGSTGQLTFDQPVLIFTAADFNVPQIVEVSAVDDSVAEQDPHTAYVIFTVSSDDVGYNGYQIPNLTVSIDDNDCGAGPFLPGDYDQNCIVDIRDIVFIARQWLVCTLPNVPECIDIN